MRNYKYIWLKSPNEIVVSGLEFPEYKEIFTRQVLILLKHNCQNAKYDIDSRFDIIDINGIIESQQEIYSWGDFVFVHLGNDEMCKLSKDEVKSLLYYSHTGIFENDIIRGGIIGGCYVHDDGWYFSYTGSRVVIDKIIEICCKSINYRLKLKEDVAIIIYNDKHYEVPATNDIDYILNKVLRNIKSAQQRNCT
jgi:hypothetical protein